MLMATQSPKTVVGITAVLLFLDALAVALRFKARRSRLQPLKADDWLSLVSFVLACGLGTILFIGVAQHALGYPTLSPSLRTRTAVTESNEKIIITARLQYIFLVISVPTLGAIKLSVVCFYRRIFVVDKSNPRNAHNLLYIIVQITISIWIGGFLLSFMLACKGKFSAWWTSAISRRTNCVNTLAILFAFVVLDFITDTLVIILPIPMIWRLHLPTGRKLGLTIVFLLGILATIFSMIRMIWVMWVRRVGFDSSHDEDLLITTLLFWSMLEISLGIIASCLPVLRGLLQTHSVDSFVNSVRSKISLRSVKASSTNGVALEPLEPQSQGPYEEIKTIDSKSKQPITKIGYVHRTQSESRLEEGNIHVDTSFELQSRHHNY